MPVSCPHCNAKADCHTHQSVNSVPKEDDFTICVKCGMWSKFGPEAKSLLKLTPEDKVILGSIDEAKDLARQVTLYLSEKFINKEVSPPPT